jgi:hypothetical protein
MTLGYDPLENMRLRVRPRVVLNQPTFHPAIYYKAPRMPLAIPWFQLRPAQGELRPEHVLAPQFFPNVDLLLSAMICDQRLLSILIPCLSRAFPDLPIRRHVAPFPIDGYDWFRLSDLREFQLSDSRYLLSSYLPEWKIC